MGQGQQSASGFATAFELPPPPSSCTSWPKGRSRLAEMMLPRYRCRIVQEEHVGRASFGPTDSRLVAIRVCIQDPRISRNLSSLASAQLLRGPRVALAPAETEDA
jgi:hypothetical protein